MTGVNQRYPGFCLLADLLVVFLELNFDETDEQTVRQTVVTSISHKLATRFTRNSSNLIAVYSAFESTLSSSSVSYRIKLFELKGSSRPVAGSREFLREQKRGETENKSMAGELTRIT